MKRSALQKPKPIVEVEPPPRLAEMWRAFGLDGCKAYRMGNLSIFAGREPMGFRTSPIDTGQNGPLRWHLSIAHPARYPTWDEMSAAREKLLPADLVFVMVFPAAWDIYVNSHPHCFHLWEAHDRDG